MTRDTFIDGESTGIEPLDRFGRQVALPPNSTANASFLIQLRNLLVQDQDMDNDGKAETLRLLFATPRRWLEDGQRIIVQRAPPAFGEVSITAESQLSRGKVVVTVDLPPRVPAKTLLRLRLPEEWKVTDVTANGKPLDRAGPETFEVSALRGKA